MVTQAESQQPNQHLDDQQLNHVEHFTWTAASMTTMERLELIYDAIAALSRETGGPTTTERIVEETRLTREEVEDGLEEWRALNVVQWNSADLVEILSLPPSGGRTGRVKTAGPANSRVKRQRRKQKSCLREFREAAEGFNQWVDVDKLKRSSNELLVEIGREMNNAGIKHLNLLGC